MKTASSKAKGRKLQQWTRDLLLDIFPVLEPDDVKSTGMGQQGEDIQLSPAARKLIPYSVECKNRTTIATYAWYKQASANAPKGCEPVLVIKQNRDKPLVIVDAEYFFRKDTK